MSTIEVLSVTVPGRPAPQGSKKTGSAGQLREASPYLPAWRAAVKRAVYMRYQELGVEPGDLPLLRGPVAFGATFYMPADRRVDSPPDLDKLLRAVWDSLTAARVWEDDGRVVEVDWLSKVAATEASPWTGARLKVRAIAPRLAGVDVPHYDAGFRCARCGAERWVGWRAGPEHEGWPRKAQCVPCGHVQDLPSSATEGGAA